MPDLVIIPVYNEAKNIAQVIPEICRHINARRTHILAIDDGSTDDSARLIKTFGCTMLMRHRKNYGYGKTLIDGFSRAIKDGYRRIVTIDCDEQHQPARIPEFIKKLDKVDILSGSRYLRKTGKAKVPVDRLKINKRMTALINQLTGYHLTDAFCGFKGYDVKALKGLRLKETGYGMPLEFWIKAAFAGLKVKEIPVDLIYTDRRRRFRRGLDDPDRRLKYYNRVLERALKEVGWGGKVRMLAT